MSRVNYVDFIIIVVLLLGVLRGWSRGLITTLGGLAGYLISFWAGLRYAPPLGKWLDQRFDLTARLAPLLDRYLGAPLEAGRGLTALLDPQVRAAVGSGSDPAAGVVQSLASFAVNALAMILIVILTLVVIRLVVGAVSRVVRHTFIGVADRAVGALFGALTAALVLVVILGLLAPFVDGGGAGPLEALSGSLLVPYFTAAFTALTGVFWG